MSKECECSSPENGEPLLWRGGRDSNELGTLSENEPTRIDVIVSDEKTLSANSAGVSAKVIFGRRCNNVTSASSPTDAARDALVTASLHYAEMHWKERRDPAALKRALERVLELLKEAEGR